MGLTKFILDMIRGSLGSTDTTRLAAKYQIPEATARGFLDAWSRT